VVERYRGVAPTAWGLSTPGVHLKLGTDQPVVALTFDACGGPHPRGAGSGYDRELIALLRRYRVRATLFLNRRWMAANPGITAELLADPLFEIGNHGTRHVPLSVTGRSAYGIRGTSGRGEVYDEIMGNQAVLAERMGRGPAWFRPGTAFCDDVAVRLAGDLGVRVAGFRVNGDEGATASRAQVVARLGAVQGGDIVISHFNRPEHNTFEGYRDGLPRLLDRGLRPVTLSEVGAG
jgi:peptidoglycan/xylan/chitin deacetylase (PgdA/CDA1 family)